MSDRWLKGVTYSNNLSPKDIEIKEKDKEIERLNNIINDIRKDIEVIEQIDSIDIIKMNLRTIIYKVKGVDKE